MSNISDIREARKLTEEPLELPASVDEPEHKKRGHKFTPAQRENNRTYIAEQMVKGRGASSIAKELGVSTSQVLYDLKIVEKRWRESSIRDFDEARALELAKIDQLEREYWEAWERSKAPKQSTSQRTAPSSSKSGDLKVTAELKTEERDGDSRFLDGVFKCIERRIKLFGLDAPDTVTMVGQFSVGDKDDVTRRLEKYQGVLGGGSVQVATAVVVSNHPGQPLDSERPAPEASNILDID